MYKNLCIIIVTVNLFAVIASMGGVILINESAWSDLKESYFETKTDQIKYFIEQTGDELNDLISSHAIWTDARMNLIQLKLCQN